MSKQGLRTGPVDPAPPLLSPSWALALSAVGKDHDSPGEEKVSFSLLRLTFLAEARTDYQEEGEWIAHI